MALAPLENLRQSAAHLIVGHLPVDLRVSDVLQQNKPDGTSVHLFIMPGRLNHFFRVQSGNRYRKAELPEGLFDLLKRFLCHITAVRTDPACRQRPNRYAVAVEHLKLLQFFYGMAKGVAEIQKCPLSLLFGIPFHHVPLDLIASADHRQTDPGFPPADRLQMFLQPFIIRPVPDQAVLEDFSQT